MVLLRTAEAALRRDPDPLPEARVEGVLPTLPSFERARQARRDWNSMAVLASAYALTGEPRFRDGYRRLVSAWLDVYRISGNPIDETGLGDWLLAFRSAGGALPPELAQRLRQWACELADRHLRPQPASAKTSTNNWQSHRVKLAVMGALVCGDPARIDRAEAAFAAQVAANLLPRGESVDFAERDAIHYVVYSIEPLLEAALFAQQHGRSLWTIRGPQGQSISRTLEWLAPYARGDKIHQEFVRSQVPFDAQRSAAGVPGFAGPFEPRKAQWSFWLAAQLDPAWRDLIRQLGQPWVAQRAAWVLR